MVSETNLCAEILICCSKWYKFVEMASFRKDKIHESCQINDKYWNRLESFGWTSFVASSKHSFVVGNCNVCYFIACLTCHWSIATFWSQYNTCSWVFLPVIPRVVVAWTLRRRTTSLSPSSRWKFWTILMFKTFEIRRRRITELKCDTDCFCHVAHTLTLSKFDSFDVSAFVDMRSQFLYRWANLNLPLLARWFCFWNYMRLISSYIGSWSCYERWSKNSYSWLIWSSCVELKRRLCD